MMNFYSGMNFSKFKTAFFGLLEMRMIPYGGGINYDYEVLESKKYFIIKNAYDVMSEYGVYIGTIPFTLYIDKINGTLKYIYFNNLTNHKKYIAQKYEIKSYLIDMYQPVF